MDYDQLLAKPPQKPGAVFHWHQVGAERVEALEPRAVFHWHGTGWRH